MPMISWRSASAGRRPVALPLPMRSPRRRRALRIAMLGLAVCTAAAANAATLRPDPDNCAALMSADGLLPDEVSSAWQCDAEPREDSEAVAPAPDADAKADARLMLIVGVSSGAGWLARGLHKD